MVDRKKLREKIDESGMTLKAIGKQADVEPYTITRRLNGDGEFTVKEMVGLSKALKLKVSEQRDIFLRNDVTENKEKE